jgi:putative aldouronate transport system substrate-binding protein
VATLQTNIENFATQSSLQFVTGQKNIDDDAAWNAYLKGLNDLGLPRYLELQQQAYQGR